MQKAKELLSSRHQVVTTALTRRSNERMAAMAHIVSLDNQIVHLTNEQFDLATAMCRLDGLNNTFMPINKVTVETSDAYVPNPFPDAEDTDFSEDDGFLLEAADQLGGMKYIDGDTVICAFTREGLLKMLRAVNGTEKSDATERKTYDQLADELEAASDRYHGSEIRHVKSGGRYRIVGVHHRESDMAVCVEYTPIGSAFHNRVKFARSIEEMGFGTRFVFVGGILK